MQGASIVCAEEIPSISLIGIALQSKVQGSGAAGQQGSRAASCGLRRRCFRECLPALRTVKATSLPSSDQEGKLIHRLGGTPVTTNCLSGGTGTVVCSVT